MVMVSAAQEHRSRALECDERTRRKPFNWPAWFGGLTVCVGLPALAAEPAPAVKLQPDKSFNARWDECEARGRKKGMPPGTKGYGEFIEDCVRNASPKDQAAGRR
jgi:hypothetical protein